MSHPRPSGENLATHLVVGAGVSGLSCALALSCAGVPVRIWARELPHATTSRVAAALWYPYRVAPIERVRGWALASYAFFDRLTASRYAAAGVRHREVLELFPADAHPADWRLELAGFRVATQAEVPEGYGSAYLYQAPVVDTGRYLDFLVDALRRRGIEIETRTLESWDAAFDAAPVVINCVGLGARELCNDPAVHPLRGQIHRVNAPRQSQVVLDEYSSDEVRYVVPRIDDCILGGSAEPGREDLEVDAAVRERIVDDCRRLAPALEGSTPLGDHVGLRPCRDEVRLEVERHPRGTLVHNYGHGGAGVTVSWGCAAEVLERLELEMPHAPWA